MSCRATLVALDPRLRGVTVVGWATFFLTAHVIPAQAGMSGGGKAAARAAYSVTLPPVPPRRVSDFTTLPCRTFT